MTIKELKELLEQFDENKEVFVFVDDSATVYGVADVSDNNGHLQLNAE